jgi:hypothetical protein
MPGLVAPVPVLGAVLATARRPAVAVGAADLA